MIKGFEQQTKPLTKAEQDALPLVVEKLRQSNGKAKTITSIDITYHLSLHGIKFDSSRIRKIINYVRIKGILPNLLSSSAGYYLASTEKEFDDYIKSLSQRIEAIEHVRDSLVKQKSETKFV